MISRAGTFDAVALVPEAHGGRGGIARYLQDLLDALCVHPRVRRVRVLSRKSFPPDQVLPPNLTVCRGASGRKVNFISAVLREIIAGRGCSLVLCGHLHLAPAARLIARSAEAPLVSCIYGIESWEPPQGLFVGRHASVADRFIAISRITASRFRGWACPQSPVDIIPNAIDLVRFRPGPRRADLVARYGIEGRSVVMMMGRMDASERYKGFDELLEIHARLEASHPGIIYLMCGDGSDRERLERKAADLRLGMRVVFTGWIPEEEKADHLRLADVFAMPGRGEGFGFVYLEALACGIPVVGSLLDGSREALLDGALGAVVDPDRPEEVAAAVLEALAKPRGGVSDKLAGYSAEIFRSRVNSLVDAVVAVGHGGQA